MTLLVSTHLMDKSPTATHSNAASGSQLPRLPKEPSWPALRAGGARSPTKRPAGASPRQTSQARAEHAFQDYHQPYIGDIDNFLGIEPLRNYFISSMKDDGYGLGPRSVGVLQLYNKVDLQSIGSQDCGRIEHVAKLVGGLSQKCFAVF